MKLRIDKRRMLAIKIDVVGRMELQLQELTYGYTMRLGYKNKDTVRRTKLWFEKWSYG